MALKNWKKSEIYGTAKWYHRETGDTIEEWQRGNHIFSVYLRRHGSQEKKTLGTFSTRKKAFSFIKKYMRNH